jgi:hypothetical protein
VAGVWLAPEGFTPSGPPVEYLGKKRAEASFSQILEICLLQRPQRGGRGDVKSTWQA